MFGKNKEKEAAESEAEKKRQEEIRQEAYLKHQAELEEKIRKEEEEKSEKKSKIMKLDDRELLAEILFELRKNNEMQERSLSYFKKMEDNLDIISRRAQGRLIGVDF
jgi:hypothetical protein